MRHLSLYHTERNESLETLHNIYTDITLQKNIFTLLLDFSLYNIVLHMFCTLAMILFIKAIKELNN